MYTKKHLKVETMLPRLINKVRDKLLVLFIIMIFLVGTTYLYVIYLQEYYKNVQWSEQRCVSELSSVKYQLNVITEYKDRIDKLLTEKQKAHETDKERYKEMLDSCLVFKQQAALCQNQFEDLQTVCKSTKERLSEVTKELDGLKTQHR